MKRYFAVFLLAVFSLSLLSGCGLFTFTAKLDAAENAAERQMERMEDAAEEYVERQAENAAVQALPATDLPEAALTGEDAWNIALEHAGFSAEEVEGLRAEGEIDDGVPHYDVSFLVGFTEYEYEIHAETGEILSFERDD